MTLYQFNQAPHADQLQLVFLHGTFVANRWEGNEGVNLYYLDGPGTGFWVELYYAPAENAIVRVRSFRSAEPLGEYVAGVELPEGWA
ncbi:MAG: hypothetical protein ACRYFX_14885 [Janthinobacterium lividum]